jgi:hypothetical protein
MIEINVIFLLSRQINNASNTIKVTSLILYYVFGNFYCYEIFAPELSLMNAYSEYYYYYYSDSHIKYIKL